LQFIKNDYMHWLHIDTFIHTNIDGRLDSCRSYLWDRILFAVVTCPRNQLPSSVLLWQQGQHHLYRSVFCFNRFCVCLDCYIWASTLWLLFGCSLNARHDLQVPFLLLLLLMLSLLLLYLLVGKHVCGGWAAARNNTLLFCANIG